MTWARPEAFWLLLLVPVLVVLFLHRRRTTPITVPSLLFWQEYGRPVDGPPPALALHNLLNLLVQVVLLCLLIFALASPDMPQRRREHLVLVVDTSATMQTVSSDGRTRLQEAIGRGEDLLAGVPDDTLITLVEAGILPRVRLKAVPDKGAVRAVLSALSAADVDPDLHEAVRLAASIRVGDWPTRIVCISDFVGTEELLANGNSVTLVQEQVGVDSPNCGIVELAPADGQEGLNVTIGQHGLDGRRATVEVLAGQQRVGSATAELKGPLTSVHVPAELAAGAVFTVRLTPEDALPLDNVARGVWPASDRVRVRLVTRGNPFLEQAIRAQPTASLQVVRPEAWDPGAPADVTVVDDTEPGLFERINGRAVVFMSQGNAPNQPGSTGAPLSATYWSPDHPVLRDIDPSLWRVRRLAGGLPDGVESLAGWQDQPLVCQWSPSGGASSQSTDSSLGHVVIFNFDLADTDLPLRPAFPIVLWNAIRYASSLTSKTPPVARRTSEVLELRGEPAMASPPTVEAPSGESHPMLRQGDRWVWLDTTRQGVYMTRLGGTTRQVAMNWCSARSSMPYVPMARAADEPAPPPPGLLASQFALPWQVLLGLTLAAGVLEWVLFQRRVLDMRQV